jgi:hypothetical protein
MSGSQFMTEPVTLALLPGRFAVCRLAAETPVPSWVMQGAFFSVTRTADELSVVCDEEFAPPDVQVERGWAALRVVGVLEFGLTGVLAGLVAPLAAAGVSVLAIATYDTDYLLVQEAVLVKAVSALKEHGYAIEM